MFETTSKFPKFFIYMLLSLAIMIFAGMFFSLTFVSIIYFVALLLSVVFLILDRKYGTILTNYKLTFLLFDLINLIAVIAILYYEFTKHTLILNVFLFALVGVNLALMLIDVFLIKNKNLTKSENVLVDVVKLCSMISILTYFFKVSILFYAIDALAFEVANLVLKVYVNTAGKKKYAEPKEEKQENVIVNLIRSTSDEEELD